MSLLVTSSLPSAIFHTITLLNLHLSTDYYLPFSINVKESIYTCCLSNQLYTSLLQFQYYALHFPLTHPLVTLHLISYLLLLLPLPTIHLPLSSIASSLCTYPATWFFFHLPITIYFHIPQGVAPCHSSHQILTSLPSPVHSLPLPSLIPSTLCRLADHSPTLSFVTFFPLIALPLPLIKSDRTAAHANTKEA